MKLKFSVRSLELINTREVEEYLFEMAQDGWSLIKISLGIFVFERSRSRELDFKILTYELETGENLHENNSWIYILKYNDLYIYYRDKLLNHRESNSMDIQEYAPIEKKINEKIRSYIISIFAEILTIYSLFIGNEVILDFIKNGIMQIMFLVLSTSLILNFLNVVKLLEFRHKKKENIYNKEIDYISLDGLFMRFMNRFKYIVGIVAIVYLIFTSDKVSRDIFILSSLGILIYVIVKMSSEGSKTLKRNHSFMFIVMFIVLIGLVTMSTVVDVEKDFIDRESYKVLMESDFDNTLESGIGNLCEEKSILVPKSYEYISDSSIDYDFLSILTEYNLALNEGIAKFVFESYIKTEERIIKKSIKNNIKLGQVEDYYGLNKDELFKEASSSILIRADEDLWNVDEAYYLSKDKNIILLRKGLEIYKISNLNLGDRDIISKTKEILDLDR